jgi:dienelactone hydrolase
MKRMTGHIAERKGKCLNLTVCHICSPLMDRGVLRTIGGVVLLALVATSCSGDDDTADKDSGTDEEQAVSTHEDLEAAFTEEVFVDSTRPTSASQFAPGADSRTLKTRIAYPSPLEGEAPLIILAHGLWGSPSKFTDLMTAWAEAGYIVAAPTFPRSTEDQPGGEAASDVGDVANQPADVSFVIDEMLRLAGDPDSAFYKHVDEDRIGLAGHSLGGVTAYGAVFNTCCRDDRIVAGAFLAGPRDLLSAALGGTFEYRPFPSLLIVADGDFVYESSRDAFPSLESPKWLITLHGGDVSRHASPFEDADDPADQLVVDATVAFWDMQLRDDRDAQERLETAAQPSDGSATLQKE